jgi:hypothetical protein
LVIRVANFHAVPFPEPDDSVVFDADDDLAISPPNNLSVIADVARRLWHPVVPDYLAF